MPKFSLVSQPLSSIKILNDVGQCVQLMRPEDRLFVTASEMGLFTGHGSGINVLIKRNLPMNLPPMTCPICEKKTDPDYRPFCSNRCANVDLGKWLTEQYVLPETGGSSEEEPADDIPNPMSRLH